MSEIYEYRLVSKKTIQTLEPIKLIDSKDVYNFALKYIYNEYEIDVNESFHAIYINNNNIVKGYSLISEGGLTSTIVDQRLMFSMALKCLATYIFVLHNHPSGSLKPSSEDEFITKKIATTGSIMDIKLLDHLILTKDGYISFLDEGMFPQVEEDTSLEISSKPGKFRWKNKNEY